MKKGSFRYASVLAVCLVLLCIATLTVSAEPSEELAGEWEGFTDSIPDELLSRLPEGALNDGDSFGESVSEMSGSEYVLEMICEVLGVELGAALKMFALILAVLLISALLGAVSHSMHSPSLSVALRLCSVGATVSSVIYVEYRHFERLEEFFNGLEGLMGGMIPVISGIWAMGGNVGTAGAGSATFFLMLAVCHGLCAATVVPVSSALSVLGFCDAMCDGARTGRVMSAIRKIYNFLLNSVMTVLIFSLSSQTVISAAADSAAARAARLVSGSVIPVIGGSIGDTFGTLASSVAYLKSSFGVGGILLIAMHTLPLLASVLLTRAVLMISAGIADMLGCSGEARLLENLSEVYGCILGVLAGASVMFVIGLCVFMNTAVAVG